MPGRFPYQKLAKYPHMMPEDVAVWEKYIERNPDIFNTVDYDIAMGTGAEVNPEHEEHIQRDHRHLTKKRIDVVAYVQDAIWLIEIKPIANARALGQALIYRKLYQRDHPELSNIKTMVLCHSVENELEPIFEEHDIILVKV